MLAHPPQWLTELLTEPAPPPPLAARTPPVFPVRRRPGTSPIDAFNAAATWHGILEASGWRCVRGDGESTGSGWCHPMATSPCSATVGNDGRLYVFSPNTPLTQTEAGRPMGHSRFDVWCVLVHAGNRAEALNDLRTTGAVA